MTESGGNGSHGTGASIHGGRSWATGKTFGGRYAVGRIIGEGGWAETYEGQDLLLGRTVAIKILRTQFSADPALVDRFEREARISASISHPNVVTVYDYGTENGSFFIALQFVAGEDLKQTVVRRGRIPVPEALQITQEILRGLSEIHRAGIVHRDVKPQNVLMGSDGLIRITDFGIAHQELATRVTTHGDAMGTAAYMAPEQAQGEDVTAATDIYAVGVVLYELLTGRLPFNRGHAMAILLAHIQETPLSPSETTPDAGIPPWIDSVVLRAMAKNPSDRYLSASAMHLALSGPDTGATATAPITGPYTGSTATAPIAGAARRPASPTGRSGPIVDRIRRPGATAVVTGTAPAQITAAGGRSRSARKKSGSPRGYRLAVSVLSAVMAIAIIGIALASMSDGSLFGLGGDDDEDATPTVQGVPALSTAADDTASDPSETAEAENGITTGEPTEGAGPTVAPRPTVQLPVLATEVPTVEPTEPPVPTDTPEPTVVPEPTETPVPTETPTPTETPVPVEVDPTEPPDEVTEPTDVAVVETGQQAARADAGAGVGGGDVTLAELDSSSWSGGADTRVDDDAPGDGLEADSREVMVIDSTSDADSVATAVFDLEEVPPDGITVEIEVRLDEGTTNPGALSVSVNAASMADPVDLSGGGERWNVVDISVPAEALYVGSNEIVASVVDISGPSDGRATILLGDITVTRAGETADASSREIGNTREQAEPSTDPLTDTDESIENSDFSEPTIAPV